MTHGITLALGRVKNIIEGLRMALKENIEKLRSLALTIAISIIAVLIASAFIGSRSAKNINDLIDARVDQRIDNQLDTLIVPKLEAIDAKLNFLVNASYDAIVKAINKQCEKMSSDPEDIKIVDIKQIMRDWIFLPPERKTDDLVMKYERIKAWYMAREAK